MISFNSSGVSAAASAADAVWALLMIIADPQRATDYLVEMKKVLDDAGRDAARLEGERQAELLAKRSSALDDRERQLDQREKAIADCAARLAKDEAAVREQAARIRVLLSGEPLAA